jgi:hypothetical protein
VLGRLHLPRPDQLDHLGWYAGLFALAAFEIIDWPVAAVIALGKVLADNHRYRMLEEFGEALDEVA